jgi:hypothetical protein
METSGAEDSAAIQLDHLDSTASVRLHKRSLAPEPSGPRPSTALHFGDPSWLAWHQIKRPLALLHRWTRLSQPCAGKPLRIPSPGAQDCSGCTPSIGLPRSFPHSRSELSASRQLRYACEMIGQHVRHEYAPVCIRATSLDTRACPSAVSIKSLGFLSPSAGSGLSSH